jgi:hypothetical protein
MRVHAKWARVEGLRPDVAVIPECARPEVLFRRIGDPRVSGVAWTGAQPQKGLLVATFGRWTIGRVRRPRRRDDHVLMVDLEGPASIRLVAVWFPPRPTRFSAWMERLPRDRPTIVAGDFNQAIIRVRMRRKRPTRLAMRLGELGFTSVYHASRGLRFGEEADPTFFLNKDATQGHHVDFSFVRGLDMADERVAIGRGRKTGSNRAITCRWSWIWSADRSSRRRFHGGRELVGSQARRFRQGIDHTRFRLRRGSSADVCDWRAPIRPRA